MTTKKHPLTIPYNAYSDAVNAYRDAIYPVTRLRDDLQRLRDQYANLPAKINDYRESLERAHNEQRHTMEEIYARWIDEEQAALDAGINAYLGEHPARLVKAEAEASSACPPLFDVVLSRARAVADGLGKEFTYATHLPAASPSFDRFDTKQIGALVVTTDGMSLDDLSKAAYYEINKKKIKKQQARENVKPLDLRPILQACGNGTWRVEPDTLLHALEVRDDDGRTVVTANDYLAIDFTPPKEDDSSFSLRNTARAIRVGMLREWLKLADGCVNLMLTAEGMKLDAGVTRACFKWLDMRHQSITGKIALPTFIEQAPPEVSA